MFSHLQELVSFDTAAPPPEESEQKNDGDDDNSEVFLAPVEPPVEEEPMEEIALEVTRSQGVIVPQAPGAGVVDDAESTSLSASSSAGVGGGDEQKKWMFPWSKSKSGETIEATSSRGVLIDKSADKSDDDSFGEVVAVAAVSPEEKAPAYKYKRETNKKAWLLCLLLLAVIAAVVIPCVLLIPGNNDRSSDSAASGTGGGTTDEGTTDGDATDGGATDGDTTDGGAVEDTASPTAAPTVADDGLPPQCEPIYDTLDSCLVNEITQDEADGCISCVWGSLPENTGPCDTLAADVCGILSECECLSCVDELQEYLDCQSDCEIDCGF